MDLNYFFQEWIYGEGYPKYTVGWNYKLVSGNSYEITFRLKQNPNTNPVLFKTPVQVKVNTTNGSVSKTFFNELQEQGWVFNVEGLPTSLTFDPDNWILKDIVATTSVNESQEVPTIFSLSQNYPNPFNPSTIISYQLPVICYVTLKIYDVLGREVATLVDGIKPAGTYNSTFSILNLAWRQTGSKFSSGVYFYTLRAGNYIETKKMILLK